MPIAPFEKQPSFAIKIIGAIAAFLVVLGIIASVAVFLARSQVDRVVEKLEERTGRTVTIGSVDISLIEGLAIRNVSLTKPDSDDLHLRVALIQTDLSFLDLLSGKKRPTDVTIRGLETRVNVRKHGVRDFDDLIRRRTKPKKPKKPKPRSHTEPKKPKTRKRPT